MPYVVVADDAFTMKPYLIKPYPDRLYDDTNSRVFNYRLSRARRVVEHAFEVEFVILNGGISRVVVGQLLPLPKLIRLGTRRNCFN